MTNEEFGVVFDDFLSYMEKQGVEKPSFQFIQTAVKPLASAMGI